MSASAARRAVEVPVADAELLRERDVVAPLITGCLLCHVTELERVAVFFPDDRTRIGGLSHVWYAICASCFALPIADLAARVEAAIDAEFRNVA